MTDFVDRFWAVAIILFRAACIFLISWLASSELAAMEFEQAVWRGHQVLKASGEIVQGDAIKLADLLFSV